MCFPFQQPDIYNHDAICSELKTPAKATLSCLLLSPRMHYRFLFYPARCLLGRLLFVLYIVGESNCGGVALRMPDKLFLLEILEPFSMARN